MRFFKFLLLSVFVFCSAQVAAHTTSNSTIAVDVDRTHVYLNLMMPADQLYLAQANLMNLQAGEAPSGDSPINTLLLTDYLARHIEIESGSMAKVSDIGWNQIEQTWFISAKMTFSFSDEVPDKLKLSADPILHTVITHKILVSIRHDSQLIGATEHTPDIQQLGYQHTQVELSRNSQSWLKSLFHIVWQGALHIMSGFDHLLFLICLLLAVPAANKYASQVEKMTTKSLTKGILLLVSAFTLGHTVSLFLSSYQVFEINRPAIEILVALSIFIAAIQLMFSRIKPMTGLLAFCFGIIHGIAFSEALSGFSFLPQTLMWAIFGFNLGVELCQLFIVVLVLPVIKLSLKYNRFDQLKNSGAYLTLVLSSIWMFERSALYY